MKAYGLDLRGRIVGFVNAGGGKVEAAKRFGVARKTVYNYLTLVKAGALAPKESWGSWKKFEPANPPESPSQSRKRFGAMPWMPDGFPSKHISSIYFTIPRTGNTLLLTVA